MRSKPVSRRLGKHAPRVDHRTLRLPKYLGILPPAPSVFNLTWKISKLGVMLNTDLGDCTIAAAGHMVQAWTAERGVQCIIPDPDILAAYEGACGYDPKDPSTDCGGVEIDVLNYWRKTGIGGHQIGAYAAINPGNITQLKQAIWLFGAVYTGFSLPKYVEDADSWEIAPWWKSGTKPNSWGGHAVPLVAYDNDFFTAISWGEYVPVSPGFIQKYMDESYAVLSKDQLDDNGSTPSGFNNTQLANDLRLVV